MDRSLLEKKALAELREIASALELRGYKRMRKADLVDLIIGESAAANGVEPAADDTAVTDDAEVDDTAANDGAGDDGAGEDGADDEARPAAAGSTTTSTSRTSSRADPPSSSADAQAPRAGAGRFERGGALPPPLGRESLPAPVPPV